MTSITKVLGLLVRSLESQMCMEGLKEVEVFSLRFSACFSLHLALDHIIQAGLDRLRFWQVVPALTIAELCGGLLLFGWRPLKSRVLDDATMAMRQSLQALSIQVTETKEAGARPVMTFDTNRNA
jgi:hypothetical protein